MAVFSRNKDVETLVSYLNNSKINIIAGIRRSGKSYLLGTLFPNYLIQEDMFAKEEIELWDLSGNQSHLHNKDIFTKLKL